MENLLDLLLQDLPEEDAKAFRERMKNPPPVPPGMKGLIEVELVDGTKGTIVGFDEVDTP